MKKYLILIILGLSISSIQAQVGGLSASKLGTLSTSVVPEGTIEFEPFFGYSLSTHYFNEFGDRKSLYASTDTTLIFSSIGFRFTYGLAKNLEVGISTPMDVSEIAFGAKYKMPFEGKLTMSLLAGYKTIVGNQIYVHQDAAHEESPSLTAGIIMGYTISNRISVDFDAQYQKHSQLTSLGHYQGFYMNSDIGYYLMDNVNFIMGLNYNFQSYDEQIDNAHLLTLNTGVAIEKAKNFILVLNAPFDLFGKNEYQTKGFGLALTIMLN